MQKGPIVSFVATFFVLHFSQREVGKLGHESEMALESILVV